MSIYQLSIQLREEKYVTEEHTATIEQEVFDDGVVDRLDRSGIKTILSISGIEFENPEDQLRLSLLLEESVIDYQSYASTLFSNPTELAPRVSEDVILESQRNPRKNGLLAGLPDETIPEFTEIFTDQDFPLTIRGQPHSKTQSALETIFDILPSEIHQGLADLQTEIIVLDKQVFKETTRELNLSQNLRGFFMINKENGRPTIIVRNNLSFIVLAYVLIHELSHVIDYIASHETPADENLIPENNFHTNIHDHYQTLDYHMQDRFLAPMFPGAFPSFYGSTNEREWFAESFTFYMLGKNDLGQYSWLAWAAQPEAVFQRWKKRDPVAYLMMVKLEQAFTEQGNYAHSFSINTRQAAQEFLRDHPELTEHDLSLWREQTIDQRPNIEFAEIIRTTDKPYSRYIALQDFLMRHPNFERAQEAFTVAKWESYLNGEITPETEPDLTAEHLRFDLQELVLVSRYVSVRLNILLAKLFYHYSTGENDPHSIFNSSEFRAQFFIFMEEVLISESNSLLKDQVRKTWIEGLDIEVTETNIDRITSDYFTLAAHTPNKLPHSTTWDQVSQRLADYHAEQEHIQKGLDVLKARFQFFPLRLDGSQAYLRYLKTHALDEERFTFLQEISDHPKIFITAFYQCLPELAPYQESSDERYLDLELKIKIHLADSELRETLPPATLRALEAL